MNKYRIRRGAFAFMFVWVLTLSAQAQTYTLSVAEHQNCTVTLSPQKESYDAGDAVSVTITPDAGAIFSDFQVYYQCTAEQWWAAQSAQVPERNAAPRRASGFSYRLEIWRIDGHENEPVAVSEGSQYTFIMPANNVEIEAICISASATYAITNIQNDNGVTTTDVHTASAGTTVTVTASPSSGYMVDEVLIHQVENQIYYTAVDFIRTGYNSMTFSMPANPVRIDITYRQIPTPFELDESIGITTDIIDVIKGQALQFSRSFTAGKASTICLPFIMTSITGGKVYAFRDVSYNQSLNQGRGGWEATLVDASPEAGNLLSATQADKPYLFLPDATGQVTFSGTASSTLTTTAGTDESNLSDGTWTFHGTYSKLSYGTAPLTGTVYGFASKDKTVQGKYIQAGAFVKAKEGAYVPPFRAYLTYNGDNAAFLAPNRNGSQVMTEIPDRINVILTGKDGATTAVGTMDMRTGEVMIETWYDLSGRRLDEAPESAGIYIKNGKKVIIR